MPKHVVRLASHKAYLVIEGCYIPFDWKNSFEEKYLSEIQYYCLVMTEKYISEHFASIKKCASAIEQRLDDSFCTKELLIEENALNLDMCRKHGCNYILIDDDYKIEINL